MKPLFLMAVFLVVVMIASAWSSEPETNETWMAPTSGVYRFKWSNFTTTNASFAVIKVTPDTNIIFQAEYCEEEGYRLFVESEGYTNVYQITSGLIRPVGLERVKK